VFNVCDQLHKSTFLVCENEGNKAVSVSDSVSPPSPVTVAKPPPPPQSSSPSKPTRRSTQAPFRLPSPLPQLPVRKGVRGRRPKSETLALLKAVAEAAAAAAAGNGGSQTGSSGVNAQLAPRPHKKRGPKPGSKVRGTRRRRRRRRDGLNLLVAL